MKKILQRHNLKPKKHLGQNFLVNEDILKKIIETADIKSTDTIVEVGPGLGVLTESLSQIAQKVISIEIDKNLIPILRAKFSNIKNVEVVEEDALKFEPPDTQYNLVANIPYYITSPLLNHFLQSKNKPETITLLVQHEVAKKICEIEPDMSILALQVALFGKAKYIHKVLPGNFYPAPKVNSAIIHVQLYKPNDPQFIEQELAEKILKLAKRAFSQKRKKLSNTLRDLKDQLLKAGIDPNRRPQTLSIEEWKLLIT
mgnify:CR=1 FL=1